MLTVCMLHFAICLTTQIRGKNLQEPNNENDPRLLCLSRQRCIYLHDLLLLVVSHGVSLEERV